MDNINLDIDIMTRQLLRKSLDEEDKFYNGVHEFFVTTYKYCVKWLPLDDLFIKSSVFVNFNERNSVSFDNVQNVISKFDRIHAKVIADPTILNILEEEFMGYQSLTRDDIPVETWEKAEVSDGSHWMDVLWDHLKEELPKLFQIVISVLIIPHSNADEERSFPLIWESLVVCHGWKPSQELLKKCKAATTL